MYGREKACEFRQSRNIVVLSEQLASGRIKSHGLFARTTDIGRPQMLISLLCVT